MATERLLLRATEVATALDVSRARAYQLIASGELPSVRIGRAVRVRLDTLADWLDERETARPTAK